MKFQKVTTIKISRELMEDLKKLGLMGDSYEDVIRRLLEKHKNRNKVQPNTGQLLNRSEE